MISDEIKTFVKERNEALFSLDKKKIIGYMEKYRIDYPKNEKVFWMGIYNSILMIASAPESLRKETEIRLEKLWRKNDGT